MPTNWSYNDDDDSSDNNLERTFEEIDRDNLIADVAKALFARWAEREVEFKYAARSALDAAKVFADELEQRRANRGT